MAASRIESGAKGAPMAGAFPCSPIATVSFKLNGKPLAASGVPALPAGPSIAGAKALNVAGGNAAGRALFLPRQHDRLS